MFTIVALKKNLQLAWNKQDGHFVSGYFSGHEYAKNFTQLVQGVLWLTRNGRIFVNESIEIEKPRPAFNTLKAPRTFIGHDKNGYLYMVDVDGNEVTKEGLDVYEIAELAHSLNLYNSINLDGGGSSTCT